MPMISAYPALRCLASLLWLAMSVCQADTVLLQPPRQIDASHPLALTVLLRPEQHETRYDLPPTLRVMASADMQPAIQVLLQRDPAQTRYLSLRKGESRLVTYTAMLPTSLRGTIQLETPDYDSAPMLLTLYRSDTLTDDTSATENATNKQRTTEFSLSDTARTQLPSHASAQLASSSITSDTQSAAILPVETRRLSFHDPILFMVGRNGGNNAKLQLSFRFRLFQPDDPHSRGVLDNLYLNYTQFSIWDLQGESKPFYDTNYRPNLSYYLPDVGWTPSWLSRLSLETGVEHESNGRDGPQSRSINTLFFRPGLYFGNPNDRYFVIAPKFYIYLEKSDNPDIADYRGYVDLRFALGKADNFELAATLRKGSRADHGSIEAQLSYPLAQLLTGTAGYLVASYFYGEGESLLDYKRRLIPQFRIGYSLSR